MVKKAFKREIKKVETIAKKTFNKEKKKAKAVFMA